jgi:hypothetical protein
VALALCKKNKKSNCNNPLFPHIIRGKKSKSSRENHHLRKKKIIKENHQEGKKSNCNNLLFPHIIDERKSSI